MPPEPPAPGTESAAGEKSGPASTPPAAPAEARKPR
ncbi:mannose-binding protein, partial [Streptomyces anulatus]|nr:mannose-binding protein [Streptomyces anulatus]